MRSLFSLRAAVLAAVVAVGLACAVVVSDSGPNQAAHFALVRSLASGTAEIDPSETIDTSYVDGRYYAAKAPGLAMFTLPWYGTLRAAGLQDAPLSTGAGYRNRVWELNLFGAVLPMLALLLLMVVAAERVVPGYGLPAAVLLGAGTLLLPFSTLFFDHVLSAALGFAAFVVLLLARERDPRVWRLAAAGVLAGLAVVVEFPLGIVAAVLGLYALTWVRPIGRIWAYAAGVLTGIAPLLAYNTWAFGSPMTLGYTNALKQPAGAGAPVVGANESGLYGVGLPDPRAALSLLVSEKGLLVVTPLAIAAVLGLPLLWRTGRRAETAVCAAIPLLFLTYNAAYYLPFGGQSPGPRFLVPALPFLVLPLALVLRVRPLVVVGVGLASVAVMALATFTGPLTGVEYGIGTWLGRLERSELVETLGGRVGFESAWVGVVVFVLLLAFACTIALARLPLRAATRTDWLLLAGALGAWLLVARVGPELVPADEEHGTFEGAIAVLVLGLTLAAGLHLTRSRGAAALLPVIPALVLAAPPMTARPRWSLLVATLILCVASVVWTRGRRARPGPDDANAVDVPVSKPPLATH
jgi:hypothetical protein